MAGVLAAPVAEAGGKAVDWAAGVVRARPPRLDSGAEG